MRGRVTQTGSNSGTGDSGRNGKGAGLLGMVTPSASSGMTPTAMYLLILIFFEAAVLVFMRYLFAKVHAG